MKHIPSTLKLLFAAANEQQGASNNEQTSNIHLKLLYLKKLKNLSMKPILIAIALIATSVQANAQEFWERVNLPDSVEMSNFTFAPDGTIYVTEAGYQYKGGVYHSHDRGETWEYGNIAETSVTFTSILALSDNQTVLTGNTGSYHIYRSIDGGVEWSPLCEGLMNVYSLFESSSGVVFAGSNNIMKSMDKGETWDTVMENISWGNQIRDFAEASNGYLYAAFWDYGNFMVSGVYRSTNGGDDWELIDISDDGFTGVAINSEDVIFATSYYMGVFRSYDYGQTWDSLPGFQIYYIDIDRDDVIYVSTDSYGVWKSYNNFDSVEKIESQLIADADQLLVSPDNYLYLENVGTLMRSLQPLSTDNYAEIPQLQLSIYPNPSKGRLTLIMPQLKGHDVRLQVLDLAGRVLHNQVSKGCSSSMELDVGGLPNGVYLLRLNLPDKTITEKIIISN